MSRIDDILDGLREPTWSCGNKEDLDALTNRIAELEARIAELEQDWTAIEPDSWIFCAYPCEVRYDAQGKPTHYRALLKEPNG